MRNLILKKKTLKTKFVNLLLKNGNKNRIELLLLKTIKEVQKSTSKQFNCLIKLSVIQNYTVLMLKNPKSQKFKRKNLKKIMIPFVLKKHNRILTSLNTIILLAKKKSKKSFFLSLKTELLNSFEIKTKDVIKEELYRLTFLKKNFAHYRWFV